MVCWGLQCSILLQIVWQGQRPLAVRNDVDEATKQTYMYQMPRGDLDSFHILALIVCYTVVTRFPGRSLYYQLKRTPIVPSEDLIPTTSFVLQHTWIQKQICRCLNLTPALGSPIPLLAKSLLLVPFYRFSQSSLSF